MKKAETNKTSKYINVSWARKKYHILPRTDIGLIVHMHATWISLQNALYRIKISTKLYILSKKDYPDVENYYFEKDTFIVRESLSNIHTMTFRNQYLTYL